MARILITGASGFTGRHLARRLLAEGHQVHGVERVDHDDAGGLTMHRADLSQAGDLRRVVEELRPEKVVHLAAIANVAHGDVSEMYLTNIVGTRNLFQALVDSAINPSAVLFASSANVYGNQRDGALSEADTPQPANDYGVSKIAGEQLARIYADRLPIIVTRPFNYTGVGQSTNFLIPKLVDHARRGDRNLTLGNLDIARDFSDVRGVVDAYARLIDAPTAIGGTFNICSGKAVALRDVVAAIEEAASIKFDVTVDPSLVRANEVLSLYGTRERLEAAIGPVAMPPLHETIEWMLRA